MTSKEKTLRIAAIKEGTVIDHIPADKIFTIIRVLRLDKASGSVSVATNLPSKLLGKKGVVKIAGRELTSLEAEEIALLAPEATLNIIKDYEVSEKRKVNLPEQISGFVDCMNPNCITNKQPVATRFSVKAGEKVRLKCDYCEREMGQKQIRIL
ncbi:MAG: aspartate carbamoyltransferase regulatory subunit [Nanoarchaeota archaeon]|nr:aspartate carbamoyltransferase regulatory subunit [Nanoarchaeota archaeon]